MASYCKWDGSPALAGATGEPVNRGIVPEPERPGPEFQGRVDEVALHVGLARHPEDQDNQKDQPTSHVDVCRRALASGTIHEHS